MARVTVTAGDPESSDRAAQNLLKELHELPEVVAVEQATTPSDVPGARGTDMLAVGTLLMTLAATPEILSGVLAYLGEWIRRPGNRRGEIEVDFGNDRRITLTNPSEAERKRLIDALIREVRQR